jgi:hypothetical protein
MANATASTVRRDWLLEPRRNNLEDHHWLSDARYNFANIAQHDCIGCCPMDDRSAWGFLTNRFSRRYLNNTTELIDRRKHIHNRISLFFDG